ncbi:MAG: DUF3848 domain-containing protein [Clostridia bacterium]|nr:DUF3848 domain-containing protein [Clostridia bacterium]
MLDGVHEEAIILMASFLLFYKIIKKEVDTITLEQLNTALYEKMYAEQHEFVESLKNSTPEIVIQNAYELVIREDILLSLEENDLDAKQCKALLKEKKPLNKLFLAWEKHEGDHMNEIRCCIENTANELIKVARIKADRGSR